MDDYSVAIWLGDGVEELDFAGPYEVLTAWARDSERPVAVRTVAATTDPVTCSHGLRVIPDIAWSNVGRVDLFLLPGGDTRPLQVDDAFLQEIRDLAGGGALMTSVCTGALVHDVERPRRRGAARVRPRSPSASSCPWGRAQR